MSGITKIPRNKSSRCFMTRRTTMNSARGITSRFFLRFPLIFAALCITLFVARSLFAASADGDLMDKAKSVFGPLPASMPSPDNPITPAKVKLGRVLFYESRISIDGTVSCAKCHPMGLYAADGLKKADRQQLQGPPAKLADPLQRGGPDFAALDRQPDERRRPGQASGDRAPGIRHAVQ